MDEHTGEAGDAVAPAFDQQYWDEHWEQAHVSGTDDATAAHPYLASETVGLVPAAALDAGCGEGREAIWLASHGWRVTAADIARGALDRAAALAVRSEVADRVDWVEADLTTWEPGRQFDLVTTHYAHPAMPQLAFYDRISRWVAPGGTLLVVGHRHTPDSEGHGHGHGHGHGPPAEASVTLADILAVLDDGNWKVVTAQEHSRAATGKGPESVPLHDVVVRAARRR